MTDTTCAHCGARSTDDLFCSSCGRAFIPTGGGAHAAGTAPGAHATASPLQPAPPTQPDSRSWATAAHLTALGGALCGGVAAFIGPLAVWLLRRDTDPFAAAHAREALNFNLSVLLYAVVGGIAAALLALVTFGLALLALVPLALLLGVAYLVVSVLGAVAAGQGRAFHYPLALPLVR